MAWSKIKSIVLLVLAVTNVVLLFIVGVREWNWAKYQEEGRTYAVALLEQNGIEFLPEDTPVDMTVSPLSITWSGMGAQEDAMATALLGTYEKVAMTGDIQITYTADIGSADFYSSGFFQATYQEGSNRTSGMTFEEHSGQLLEDMGLSGTLKEIVQWGNNTTVTYFQVWEGYDIYSCPISFYYQGAYLCEIEGQRVAGSVSTTDGENLPTFSTALVQFISGINDGTVSITSHIKEMTWGYQATLNRPISILTPTWKVTTDTGIYYIDSVGITVG